MSYGTRQNSTILSHDFYCEIKVGIVSRRILRGLKRKFHGVIHVVHHRSRGWNIENFQKVAMTSGQWEAPKQRVGVASYSYLIGSENRGFGLVSPQNLPFCSYLRPLVIVHGVPGSSHKRGILHKTLYSDVASLNILEKHQFNQVCFHILIRILKHLATIACLR